MPIGFREEIQQLREIVETWIHEASPEIQPLLEWQFITTSKYFRPLTVFSAHRAMQDEPIPNRLIYSAAVVEMVHNMTLIVDDIVDASETRRGKTTLHCRSCSAGADDGRLYRCRRVQNVFRRWRRYSPVLRIDEAPRRGECMQWNTRRQPRDVEDWLDIAGEDTGSMFETCACLATRDHTLRKFGSLLGVLYHGCDDVGDVKGLKSLGGGGDEDLRDGILTLPAALAISDPVVAALFCKRTPSADELRKPGAEAAVPAARSVSTN